MNGFKKVDRKNEQKEQKERIALVIVIICTVFLLLSLRIGYITIVKGNEYRDMAQSQWNSEMTIAAERGDILDRNGAIIASSANVYRVDLDLNTLKIRAEQNNVSLDQIAAELSTTLQVDSQEIMEILEGTTMHPNVARGIEKNMADAVEELDIYGVLVLEDVKRYYPNNNYLAHVLGSINSEGYGLTGVELQYDEHLVGIPGMKIEGVDAKSNQYPLVANKYTPAVDGKDVVLTIDENIQYFAETTANNALRQHNAEGVSILVMNPNTGEILAMVNKPDYDPNNPFDGYEMFSGSNESDQLQNMWRNDIVSTPYEPGSTFKVVTMIAALEEDVASEDETFVCTGSVEFEDQTVRCWKIEGHGVQTLPEILKNSCNPGFIELGDRLGSLRLNEYIEKLGFGSYTGIDLPGEATGIVKESEDMLKIDIATTAFGQSNTVTTTQLMVAFNAIANGGDLIQPHIVKEITYEDENGNKVVDESFTPKKESDVLSEENTAKLREYLERTVTDDGSEQTFVQGYDIGGKTGTAEKIDPQTGRYSEDKYIASMIALAPVDNPQVTVYIAVDEPSTGLYYGGEVAAPLMKDLFKQILDYMNSPISKNQYSITKDIIVPEVRGQSTESAINILGLNGLNFELIGNGSKIISMDPYPGTKIKEGSTVKINAEGASIENEVVVPDLYGTTVEFATNLLDNLGLKYYIEGEGKVYHQSVPNGTLLEKGNTINLTLRKESIY